MFSIKSHRGTYSLNFIDLGNLDKVENSIAIVDKNVFDLYQPLLKGKFGHSCLIDASEENKDAKYCLGLIDYLCDLGVKKNTTLVAVGGGITQDITSFIASILYRGIKWSFIPTTLLAQADSCIGSKTSINHKGVKNLLGSFYPPKEIWCDPQLLSTLDESDIDSGIGEMLHYFMIDGSTFVDNIDKNDLSHCIAESLRIKKKMVELDEFDQNERRVFNYGHTFGHAIESISAYTVNHGLAVTLGMHIANYVSFRLGNIDKQTLDFLQSCIAFNLPEYKVKNIDQYVSALLKDKKNVDSSLVCILPYGVADYRVTELKDMGLLKSILEDYSNEC